MILPLDAQVFRDRIRDQPSYEAHRGPDCGALVGNVRIGDGHDHLSLLQGAAVEHRRHCGGRATHDIGASDNMAGLLHAGDVDPFAAGGAAISEPFVFRLNPLWLEQNGSYRNCCYQASAF
jgi:hypothetical protein